VTDLHVRIWGEDQGDAVLLVHGSNAGDAAGTWAKQRVLADTWRLLVPDRRGYGASPKQRRIDFEADVADIIDLLGSGAHLVGFSYGGVLCLLAAARRPDLVWSLTVIEPPALDVARGHPAVEGNIARMAPCFAQPDITPQAFIRCFRAALGIEPHDPGALSETDVAGIRGTLLEPPPWEARIPLDTLTATSFPKLVVSGNWNAGLEAVADVLTARLPAERAVITGAGHACQHTGEPFNTRLRAFLIAARHQGS
jgi:pimeloyl-ACP methyl ester carboxylesterase